MAALVERGKMYPDIGDKVVQILEDSMTNLDVAVEKGHRKWHGGV